MTDLLKLAVFVVFLILGFIVIRQHQRPRQQFAVNLLLAYLIGINVLIAFINRGAWPFSPYPILPSLHVETMPGSRMDYRGVDASGREHDVHPDSFSPVFPLVLNLWFKLVYPSLPADQQATAIRYLAERAETSRQRLAAGAWIGSQRLLGPAAVPDWWAYPVPRTAPEPFRAFRVYRVVWVVGLAYRDPTAVQRDLIAEYRW